MCGIAGVMTNINGCKGLADEIAAMRDSLIHRGPDDQGIYIDPNESVALAHTRLAILDTSEKGRQPMGIDAGQYQIVFNGEIYNYQDLRHELESRGVKFNSSTDTEVILNMYKVYGVECVERLRGMFSFAIWDSGSKKCFLARDPLGIKPLYYSCIGDKLVFASEIRAIEKCGFVSKTICGNGLWKFVRTGSVSEETTCLDNVYALAPGHRATWESGKLSVEPYWKLTFAENIKDQELARKTVYRALRDAVEKHLISDVPVGLFLSGGIDSTAILSLIRELRRDEPLRTFSIYLEDEKYDERRNIERSVKEFKTDHHFMLLSERNSENLFWEYIEKIDQPTIDGFNTYCVAKLARENGIKVVLSGLGGDEIFGGYRSFKEVPKLLFLRKKLGLILPALIFFMKFSGIKKSKKERFVEILLTSNGAEDIYSSFRGIFSQKDTDDILKFLGINFDKGAYKSESRIEDELLSGTNLISSLEMSRYMRNQLLKDSDVMSMSCGVELRVPFLDTHFVNTVTKISEKIRIQPNKKLLVESLPNLPEWVWKGDKKGFSFPFEKWMEKDWQSFNKKLSAVTQKDVLNRCSEWYQKWALMCLHQTIKRVNG